MIKRTQKPSSPIPGWHDLLLYIQPLNIPAAEAKRAGRAAGNLASDLRYGLSAIGELTWIAGTHEALDVSAEAIAHLGLLIQTLTELLIHLCAIENSAEIAQTLPGGAV